MRFQVLDILPHLTDPVTGRRIRTDERFAQALLGAIAATTGDPLRVAEDYATVDQLSRGRLELVIGKGNELLRRLWREEDVTWEGRFRGPAKWGDPLFSANALQPRDNYTVLIEHCRKQYAQHGHDPRFAFVGAGAGFLYLADTTQGAREAFGPTYEKAEVVPVARAAAPTTLWTDKDPHGGRPAVHGRTAGVVEGAGR